MSPTSCSRVVLTKPYPLSIDDCCHHIRSSTGHACEFLTDSLKSLTPESAMRWTLTTTDLTFSRRSRASTATVTLRNSLKSLASSPALDVEARHLGSLGRHLWARAEGHEVGGNAMSAILLDTRGYRRTVTGILIAEKVVRITSCAIKSYMRATQGKGWG